MKLSTAENVRAAMASHLLGRAAESTLGGVLLHPHQVDGVRRVNALLATHRGALLADGVGLGKTYIALAVAKASRAPLVVAPAAVRDAWQTSSESARVRIRFASIESLSKRASVNSDHDLVVVDEAHHFRNRRTLRFSVVARLCESARVLLLSATPVQNRIEDLRSILALFLGARADALEENQLARFVVRRTDVAPATIARLPRVAEPQWVGPIDDVDCLDRIASLPAPLPPADGGAAGALLTYTLARQWSSSRAALRGALLRRIAQSRAMEDALRAGRFPSRAELTAWCFTEGMQQLAFPDLAVADTTASADALLSVVDEHTVAVRGLLSALDASLDPDVERAALLARLAHSHPGERLVVFTEFADTAARIYSLMAPTIRVALITHRGGRVAGGEIGRRDILARFAPGASATPAERIDMLVTTDLLSEGVNLQSASVVVHLDLSWNPARLEQRVGRLRRLGAARDCVVVYAFAPPAPTERLLRLEQRLQHKLRIAGRSIGLAGSIVPGFVVADASATAAREQIAATVEGWWQSTFDRDGCPTAACRAAIEQPLALVCVRRDGDVELLVVDHGHMIDSPARVADVLAGITGRECAVNIDRANTALETVRTWLQRRSVADVVNLSAMRLATSRRALLHRVDAIARRAPRHAQPRLAPLMRAARVTATSTMSAGAERVLSELARAEMSDSAWLSAVSQFASLNAHTAPSSSKILALLLLEPTSGF